MFSNKIGWIGGLGLVFALLIATNLADRSSFQGARDSVASIYEDRLIAKGLLYDMRSIVATKQVALAGGDVGYLRDGYGADAKAMRSLLGEFEQTELTADEEREFDGLAQRYGELEELEEQFSAADRVLDADVEAEIRTAHDAVLAHMQVLAGIQVTEGQREQAAVSRALRTVNIITTIEVLLLVVIGVLIIGLIFFWPKKEAE